MFEEQYELQKRNADEEKAPPLLYGKYTKRKNTAIDHKPGEHILTRFVLNEYNYREIEVRKDGSWTERTVCRIPQECEEAKEIPYFLLPQVEKSTTL